MDDREVRAWRLERQARDLLGKLEKRGFGAVYAPDPDEGRRAVLNLVPENGTVGLLGSQTLERLGLYEHFRQSGRELVDHRGRTGALETEEGQDYLRRIFQAEVMLASVNALDAEGRLYNVDFIGNRVAAMIFGPRRVVLAVGLNKLVSNSGEAWRRVRHLAAPRNNKRSGHPNPCLKSGRCHDCQTPHRSCNYFSVIERSRPAGRINIVLIGRELGY